MKSFKMLVAALALTFGIAAGTAHAAECQLRNLNFVSVVNDGRLVVNSEIWNFNGTQWASLGQLGNSTYCNVNGTYNGITSTTCKGWYQVALAAMLANKKIYVTANACTAGNGVNLSGIGYFGLNN